MQFKDAGYATGVLTEREEGRMRGTGEVEFGKAQRLEKGGAARDGVRGESFNIMSGCEPSLRFLDMINS